MKNIKKINFKQILVIIGIISIIASVGVNLYFGGMKIKDNIYKKGFDSGQINLVNQIIQGSNQFSKSNYTR